MIRKVKFDQQQQKNQGNCKTNAFILNDMTEPETESRWNRAKNKMFVPENLDVCREDFLASTTLISPIFTYQVTAESRAKKLSSSLRTPRTDLLSTAISILKLAVNKYGQGNVLFASDPPVETAAETVSNTSLTTTTTTTTTSSSSSIATPETTPKTEKTPHLDTGTIFPKRTALNRKAALKYLKKYMSTNHLDNHCTVKFCDGLPSTGIFINRPRATLARIRCEDAFFNGDEDCKHSLLVSDTLLSSSENTVSAIRLVSFAVHEMGTHMVRRINEEVQPWLRKRDRYDMVKDERLIKGTEEGLAMVHEAMHLPSQLLARPALYYFASARALELSFIELFVELKQWIEDPKQRFDICALVKRGIENSGKKGGNGEVQVYFEGAINILEHIDDIDPVLLFCGRITLDDMKLSRVLRVVRREGVLVPEFARNTYMYRKKLREISLVNGIYKIKPKPVVESPVPVKTVRKSYISVGPSFTHRKSRKAKQSVCKTTSITPKKRKKSITIKKTKKSQTTTRKESISLPVIVGKNELLSGSVASLSVSKQELLLPIG